MTVAAWPLAYCCDAVAEALLAPVAGLVPPLAPLDEPPLEQAATETAAADRAAAVVRILFRTFVLLKAGSMNRFLPHTPRRSGDRDRREGIT
jgi:hypothetical protein